MSSLTPSQDPDVTSGSNLSYWTDNADLIVYKPLASDLETEVVIVGGGLAGLSVAYCLVQSGKRVVVVEDGNIGSGETGRTTAQLVTALDDRYYDLERIFGKEKTKLIAQSHMDAIDFVEKTVQKEHIDCGFERVNGYLFLHPSDKPESLEKELAAASNAGIQVGELNVAPGMPKSGKCLCFYNQAQFHPLRYLKGLCKVIEEMGGKIYTRTHADKIDHIGITTSSGFTVKAKHVVVATNTPVNNIFTMLLKQYPYRTYVIGALIPKDTIPKAMWWDTGDFTMNASIPPYHYVRMHQYNEQYDLLISGGEDHPTGDTHKTDVPEDKRYRALEDWTRRNFPVEDIAYRWSGQVMEPMDGIAFIGRNPLDHKNVYIVTGDSGNGMTHCTIAGMLISDLINERENKWEKLYRPSRFTLKESGPMFKQMLHELLSYMKQTPNFSSAKELSEIKNGEGRITDMLEEKFGVYRDMNSKLHIVSAECTHLKCTIAWNSDELSWDCPCHGSRFTFEGKVINGPANIDLPCYSEPEEQQEHGSLTKK